MQLIDKLDVQRKLQTNWQSLQFPSKDNLAVYFSKMWRTGNLLIQVKKEKKNVRRKNILELFFERLAKCAGMFFKRFSKYFSYTTANDLL